MNESLTDYLGSVTNLRSITQVVYLLQAFNLKPPTIMNLNI